MAAEITSKIVKCVFTNDWTHPQGGTNYYHDVTLENGETISLGTTEKNALKISEGAIITYKVENNKAKLLSSDKEVKSNGQQSQKNSSKGKTNGNNYRAAVKKPDDFLGFTWGYAKDLIIAGKTMKDVEELNKVARFIYAQVTDMLENGPGEQKP